jgi:DNA-binding GntR family transcriptional regulator
MIDASMKGSAVHNHQRLLNAAALMSPASTILLSEEVVSRIRETILRGLFAPGDRLREEELASALGVSRGPIRAALQQLEREGLVVRRRNRGAIVAGLSISDLEEVYSVRLAIEPVACGWASRNAEEQDLLAMQAIIDSFGRLTTKVTVQDAAEADLSFHDVLYVAARHKRLLRLWRDIRPQAYVFLLSRTYVRSRGFRGIMIANHKAIYDALRRVTSNWRATLPLGTSRPRTRAYFKGIRKCARQTRPCDPPRLRGPAR